MITATAKLRYLKITPRKARFVVDTIRGCSVNVAEARLLVSPQRSSAPILKLLRSAVANARQNAKLDPAKLVITEIRVDQGPKTGRWMPRARGSAGLIERKSCHISIVLAESATVKLPRYTIVAPAHPMKKKHEHKKAGKRKVPHAAAETGDTEKHDEVGPVPKPGKGYLKRMFRRKSV
ncbi:MAG: 50S ribosomal protein L22 [bacterium]|nr:50S ribosomal protein L22 [bacterium]